MLCNNQTIISAIKTRGRSRGEYKVVPLEKLILLCHAPFGIVIGDCDDRITNGANVRTDSASKRLRCTTVTVYKLRDLSLSLLLLSLLESYCLHIQCCRCCTADLFDGLSNGWTECMLEVCLNVNKRRPVRMLVLHFVHHYVTACCIMFMYNFAISLSYVFLRLSYLVLCFSAKKHGC